MARGLPQSLPCCEAPSGSPLARPGPRMKLVPALQGNPTPWVRSRLSSGMGLVHPHGPTGPGVAAWEPSSQRVWPSPAKLKLGAGVSRRRGRSGRSRVLCPPHG